jgi:hypothetical protein
MAITYVSGTADDSADSNNTDAVALTLGTHTTNDIIIQFAGGWDALTSGITWSTPSGYTLLADHTATPGSDPTIYVWYKIATSGSETYQTTVPNTACKHAAGVVVFRGVDTTTPFDGVTPTETSVNNDTLNAHAPITPATANGAILLLEHIAVAGTNQRPLTPGAPSGYTLGAEISEDQNYSTLVSAYLIDYGAAAEKTPGVWTHSQPVDNNSEKAQITIVLKPAAVGGSAGLLFAHYYNG